MLDSQRPDKSAVGNKQSDPVFASITEKSNLQLLDEIEAMLSVPAEEMDTDRIEEYLSLLQEKAPITAPYDPEEKWADLVESHPLIFEEPPSPCQADPTPEVKEGMPIRSRRSLSRALHTAGIAAAMILSFAITASAMGFQPVQAILRWAEGIIQVYTNPSGVMELPDDDPSEYHSLEEALSANGLDPDGLPTWVPRDYTILSVTAKISDSVTKYTSVYESDRGYIAIRVTEHTMLLTAETIERDSAGSVYTHNEVEYYILTDNGTTKAGWQNRTLSYGISGQISEDEIKEMINSIQ